MKLSVSCKTCIWWDDEHKALFLVDYPYESQWGFCCKHKPFAVKRGGYHYGEWPLVDAERGCAEHRDQSYLRSK